MSIPAPRPADVLILKLQDLTAMRARIQGELVDRLTSIDAIDRRITTTLDQLADSRRARTGV